MNDKKVYDYDDVRVFIDDKYVSYEQEVIDPDLSFTFGSLSSKLPLIVYYEDPDSISNMEEVCRKHGIITAGAPGSRIPLALKGDSLGCELYERFDPLRAVSVSEMRDLSKDGVKLLVGCSLSARHAIALTNELQLATAVLVGPTQVETTKRIESIGLTVPRVSLIEQISRATDVPLVATASSSVDVCKAFVAGADAALIHFGGPFEQGDDLDFLVKTVTDAMRDNLVELCRSSGAKTVRDLAIRCKLIP